MARSVYLRDFVDELQELGPTRFRHSYPQPFLAWVGLVGQLEERTGPKKRPTAQMEGEALEADRELSLLVNQVWLLRKETGGKRPVITAGRAAKNDLVIPEYSISQQHCEFRVRVDRTREGHPRRLFVRDTDSLNGTAVRGERIPPSRPVELFIYDEVALGRLRFVVLDADEFLKRVATAGGVRLG